MKEIEIKLKIASFEGIREKLSDLGFALRSKDKETCYFFDDENESFSDNKITVRVKRGNGWANFTVKVKKQNGDYKEAEEYQTDISDLDAMISALSVIGLVKKFEYSKEREHWTDGRSSVELDRVPEIGYFAEVEAESPKDIERMIEALGLKNAERDVRSYPDIIRKNKRTVS